MIVSHAQNFEDVMLSRVFTGNRGFYIDVGAWDPDHDTVTKMFYDRGWSGINVEPSAHYFALLQRRRPRDLNLNVAVGATVGSVDFVEIPGSGLSSVDSDAETRGRSLGFRVNRYSVRQLTLDSIYAEHAQGRDIDFLKVDVEGLEEQVIGSSSWIQFRPVVIVVEAVHPDTQAPTHQGWEPILVTHGYDFVWFDGINRFYLRRESHHLSECFSTPPNIRDGFVLSRRNQMVQTRLNRLNTVMQKALPESMYCRVLQLRNSLRRGS